MIGAGTLQATKLGRDHAIQVEDLEKLKTAGESGRPPKPTGKKD